MKTLLFIFLCGVTFIVEGSDVNYLEHPLYKCIRCLCHARSGCWRRQNCAKYSISQAYWLEAGGLTVNDDDEPGSTSSYKKCIQDENCIVGTIIRYTEGFGKLDCNCDGNFDCKDRFAIHLFGKECENPKFTKTYASRFNHCAAEIGVNHMLSEEGDDTCQAPPVV